MEKCPAKLKRERRKKGEQANVKEEIGRLLKKLNETRIFRP